MGVDLSEWELKKTDCNVFYLVSEKRMENPKSWVVVG